MVKGDGKRGYKYHQSINSDHIYSTFYQSL